MKQDASAVKAWVLSRVPGRPWRNSPKPFPTWALNGRYILDRPVLDRTGLSGVYDFMLTWTPESSGSTSDLSGPSLFTAVQEQLGLKLEIQKAQVEILVIDHVEKASAN